MKYLIIITTLFLLISCSNKTEYESNYYQNKEVQKNCIEPENPYSDWSGHYAWYEWAIEKWRACSWNSNSFIEWCEEYYTQENDYSNCVNK